MGDLALSILTSAAVSAALSGLAITFITTWGTERLRNAIKHEYDAKLESHKTRLKSDSDIEIERLKSQLSVFNAEQQVKFSGLHAKRAEVIAEVYSLLFEAYRSTKSFASPLEMAGEPNKREKYLSSIAAMAKFYEYFSKHQIYLPETTCAQMTSLVEKMRDKATAFGARLHYGDIDLEDEGPKRKYEAWDAAWEYLENEFPPARVALEKELRALLGDSSSSNFRN